LTVLMSGIRGRGQMPMYFFDLQVGKVTIHDRKGRELWCSDGSVIAAWCKNRKRPGAWFRRRACETPGATPGADTRLFGDTRGRKRALIPACLLSGSPPVALNNSRGSDRRPDREGELPQRYPNLLRVRLPGENAFSSETWAWRRERTWDPTFSGHERCACVRSVAHERAEYGFGARTERADVRLTA